MQKFSVSDLLREIKTVLISADRHPIIITQRRKSSYVIMNYAQFRVIEAKISPGHAYRTEDNKAHLAELIGTELDWIIDEDNQSYT